MAIFLLKTIKFLFSLINMGKDFYDGSTVSSREELLVFHRAPPPMADRGMLTRYGEYRRNKIPRADLN